MTLQPGQTLSHYRLVEKIGEGGMGVVWKADDTKLGRPVAVKILPPGFAKDRHRLARFEREAKILAALNDPNIATIHGLEEAGGTHFLVLELVPGQSLAETLRKGPLPLEETLDICRQVAEGLEAAHDAGVIHRDLKPGNVRVTPDGKAKVLDFGLAKGTDDGGPGSSPGEAATELSHSPTVTVGGTQAGVILGTAPYMSPEQARGKRLDRRTDIWSFGCLLYECLTGRMAFRGETVSDTLAAVLRAEPEWKAVPAGTPAPILRLLRRCLDRNPKSRLRDIGEARIAIEGALGGDAEADAAPAGAAKPRRRLGRALLLLAGMALVAVVASVVTQKSQPPLPLRKFQIEVDAADPFPIISPDGRKIVYADRGRLWIREFDQFAPREIEGSDEGHTPFWSPDGTWIGYASGGRLWKAPVRGGQRAAICDLPEDIHAQAGGAVWKPDGRVVFTTGSTGLLEVSAQGGDPKPFLEPGPEELDFHEISALPGGRGVIFVVHRRDEGSGTLALLAGGRREDLLRLPEHDLHRPVYSSTGHILYHRREPNAGIWALPFSLESLEATGEAFLVAAGGRSPSVASDGTLIYVRYVPRLTRLVWVDRSGSIEGTIVEPQREVLWPALSPDGRRVAVTADYGTEPDVWIYDLVSGTRTRLTFDSGQEILPSWSPEGDRVLYGFLGPDARDLPVMKEQAFDGTGQPQTLGEGVMATISPDGQFLAYTGRDAQGRFGLMYRPLDGDGEPVSIPGTGTFELYPRISPGGDYLAYQSDETGRHEIYIQRFPGGDGKWQVSSGGGIAPRWSRSGDRLFYLQRQDMMEAPIATRPSLRVGTPRKLFTHRPAGLHLLSGISEGFDVTADGERFLMVASADPHGSKTQIAVVQNWFAEFEERR